MPLESEYRIEAPSPSHDRTAFRSGVLELDEYLHHRAGQDARRKIAAPFVLVDVHGSILGYYTLSAYSIRLERHCSPLPTAVRSAETCRESPHCRERKLWGTLSRELQ